jgi:hypothetical protein
MNIRREVIRYEGQPASDAAPFDGGARFNSKRSVEGVRIKGIVSEVFHGKRAISRTHEKKLADFFHVGVERFI